MGDQRGTLLNLSEIRPIKLLNAQTHCISDLRFSCTVSSSSAVSQSVCCLGVVKRLAAFTLELTYQSLYFLSQRYPPVIGKETFIYCGICCGNCGAILSLVAYSNFSYAPFDTRLQFTRGDYCVHVDVLLDELSIGFSVRLFILQ